MTELARSRVYCTRELISGLLDNVAVQTSAETITESEKILRDTDGNYLPAPALREDGSITISKGGHSIRTEYFLEKQGNGVASLVTEGHLSKFLLIASRTDNDLSKMIKDLQLPF